MTRSGRRPAHPRCPLARPPAGRQPALPRNRRETAGSECHAASAPTAGAPPTGTWPHPRTPCSPVPAAGTALPGPRARPAAARGPPAATWGPDADGASQPAWFWRSQPAPFRGSASGLEQLLGWPWKPGAQRVPPLALPPSRCPRVAAPLAAFAPPAPSSPPQAPPRPRWSHARETSVIPAAPNTRNIATYRNGIPLKGTPGTNLLGDFCAGGLIADLIHSVTGYLRVATIIR